MKCVSIIGPNQFVIEEVAPPNPAPDELLIAPLKVGICGTDRELLNGSMIYLQNGLATLPLIPGHEWVGKVVDVGEDIALFNVGDLVVGECSIGCGVCATCVSGNYHRCPLRSETGFMGRDGALAELMTFPARAAHRVPNNMPLEDAALIEPSAVAYRGVRRLHAPIPARVLVVGGGSLGYLAAAVLRSLGHKDVVMLASRTNSLERVSRLGVSSLTPSERFDYVIEAAGTPSAMLAAFNALAPGGRLVLTGLTGQPHVRLPIDNVVVGDQEVLGSLGSPGVWPATIELIASGLLRPGALVTNTFGLDEYGKALELIGSGCQKVGKVLIEPNSVATVYPSH